MDKQLAELMDGLTRFRQGEFTVERELLETLALEGQHPRALFIGCCDSRYTPERILDALPGMLFIHRNIGALVAPYESYTRTAGVDAAVEYAVVQLGVQHVIVCGHTHCGAVEAVLNIESLPVESALREWLSYGQNAPAAARERLERDGLSPADHDALAAETEREFVRIALSNLMTYEFVKERVENGKLELHGWRFHIETAELEVMDEETGEFHSAGIYVPELELGAGREGGRDDEGGGADATGHEHEAEDETGELFAGEQPLAGQADGGAPNETAGAEPKRNAAEAETGPSAKAAYTSDQTEHRNAGENISASEASHLPPAARDEDSKPGDPAFKIPESLKKNAEQVKSAFEKWLKDTTGK